MKFVILLLLGGGILFAQGERGLCPSSKASQGFGICMFNPDINCTGDEGCKDGQICCPDGCNRSCKDPVHSDVKPGQCKTAPNKLGACVIDPSTSCVHDDQCNGSEKCCTDGCNKSCQVPDFL